MYRSTDKLYRKNKILYYINRIINIISHYDEFPANKACQNNHNTFNLPPFLYFCKLLEQESKKWN